MNLRLLLTGLVSILIATSVFAAGCKGSAAASETSAAAASASVKIDPLLKAPYESCSSDDAAAAKKALDSKVQSVVSGASSYTGRVDQASVTNAKAAAKRYAECRSLDAFAVVEGLAKKLERPHMAAFRKCESGGGSSLKDKLAKATACGNAFSLLTLTGTLRRELLTQQPSYLFAVYKLPDTSATVRGRIYKALTNDKASHGKAEVFKACLDSLDLPKATSR